MNNITKQTSRSSDTPETDAFFGRIDIEWDMEIEFARKLERENARLREAWYEMHSSFERSRDEVEKLIRERDEARQQIAELLRCHHDEPCTVVVLKQDAEIKRLCKERDVAREQMRLANIDCFAAMAELGAAQEKIAELLEAAK